MGSGVGGFPLDESARVTVRAVREELPVSPTIEHVIFAMRGAAAYQAFETALAAPAKKPRAASKKAKGSVRA
jgi:O-acetyl-ADP-ribose deacetylase (regulator of RNase III)